MSARFNTVYDKVMKIAPSMDVMKRCDQKLDVGVMIAAGITAGQT